MNPRQLHFASLACVLLGGCLRPAIKRPDLPEPQTPERRAARSAVISYAHALAASFDDAATRLDAGSLKTAVDTNTRLQTSNLAARQQAFQPVNELLNDELGGDRWDAGKARALFEKLADGLRSFP